MTSLTPSELLDLHTLLLGSGSARAYRTGTHRTAVKRLFDHATASQARAFSELTEDALEKMMEDSLIGQGGPVDMLLELLVRLQAFASPAPAELVKKLNAPDLLNAHADAMAFARTRADPASPSGLMLYGEHMRASIARLLSEGGAA